MEMCTRAPKGTESLILRLDLQKCTPIRDKYPAEHQQEEVTRQPGRNPPEEPTGRLKYTAVPDSNLLPQSPLSVRHYVRLLTHSCVPPHLSSLNRATTHTHTHTL